MDLMIFKERLSHNSFCIKGNVALMKKRYLSFVDVISVLICLFLIAFWLMFIAGTFWGELHLVNNALLWLAPAEVTLILMELKRKYEKSNTLH